MIITIDGPAGTGKSSVARAVAEQLQFDFLDTGAMYRAIAVAARRRGVGMDDAPALAAVARAARIEFDFSRNPPALMLDGKHVQDSELRAPGADSAASRVAVVPEVRQELVRSQRQIGAIHPNLVTEGRDQGSVVFPDARLKIYLDATPLERARRRAEQLRQSNQPADIAELARQIEERDARDRGRSVGALRIPSGAFVIDTSTLAFDAVVAAIVSRAVASGVMPPIVPANREGT